MMVELWSITLGFVLGMAVMVGFVDNANPREKAYHWVLCVPIEETFDCQSVPQNLNPNLK